MTASNCYIDKTGKIVIEPKFDIAWSFSEGLAHVRIDGKYYYIDKTGKIVVELQKLDVVGPFEEGLTLLIGRKRGFIDKAGRMVIDLKDYMETYGTLSFHLGGFSEGLAALGFGYKWGYIDKTGTIVIEPKFDRADSFSEGLAKVNIDGKKIEYGRIEGGKWGYIDKTGKYVWEPTN